MSITIRRPRGDTVPDTIEGWLTDDTGVYAVDISGLTTPSCKLILKTTPVTEIDCTITDASIGAISIDTDTVDGIASLAVGSYSGVFEVIETDGGGVDPDYRRTFPGDGTFVQIQITDDIADHT